MICQKKEVDIETILNISFFLALLGIGFGLVYYTTDLQLETLLGALFFDGGLTPLVLSGWAFITGPGTFKKRNVLKVCTSMILVGIGFILLGIRSQGEVFSSVGAVLFETGAIFFVSKMFFLAEDDEMRIERLEKQLEEAMLSPGAGMALSYFYNFVLPTAANLNAKNEKDGKTSVSMEVKRGVFEDYELQHSQLLIYIPRDLDGSDMKIFLRKITDTNSVIQGKPKERPGAGTHRPMFVYFLEWDASTHICDGLFDIPTIISSIWNRAQDQKELTVDIRQEIIIFQNALWKLVQSNPITADRVKMVSVPSTPFEISGMKLAARKVYSGEIETD